MELIRITVKMSQQPARVESISCKATVDCSICRKKSLAKAMVINKRWSFWEVAMRSVPTWNTCCHRVWKFSRKGGVSVRITSALPRTRPREALQSERKYFFPIWHCHVSCVTRWKAKWNTNSPATNVWKNSLSRRLFNSIWNHMQLLLVQGTDANESNRKKRSSRRAWIRKRCRVSLKDVRVSTPRPRRCSLILCGDTQTEKQT